MIGSNVANRRTERHIEELFGRVSRQRDNISRNIWTR